MNEEVTVVEEEVIEKEEIVLDLLNPLVSNTTFPDLGDGGNLKCIADLSKPSISTTSSLSSIFIFDCTCRDLVFL